MANITATEGQHLDENADGPGPMQSSHPDTTPKEDPLDFCNRFAADSHLTIMHLVDAYMTMVYPLFPVFDGSALWRIVHGRQYLLDRYLLTIVLATCALAAARMRDGATHPRVMKHPDADMRRELCQSYSNMVHIAMPENLIELSNVSALRITALLAMLSLQDSKWADTCRYIGHWHTICAILRFDDENTWPYDMPEDERNACRRLFWAMYKLDVLVAAQFQCPLRSRELAVNVSYPSDFGDDDTLDMPLQNRLRAWNFATDLYRMLEHLIDRSQRKIKMRSGLPLPAQVLGSSEISESQVLHHVWGLFERLPKELKTLDNPYVLYHEETLYQVANIHIAIQLLYTIVLECEGSDQVEPKCEVVEMALVAFRSMDVAKVRNMSLPLLHHLSRIGNALAVSAQGHESTEQGYWRIHDLLSSLIGLMEKLEATLQPTGHVSKGLVDFLVWYTEQRYPSTNMPHGLPDVASQTAEDFAWLADIPLDLLDLDLLEDLDMGMANGQFESDQPAGRIAKLALSDCGLATSRGGVKRVEEV